MRTEPFIKCRLMAITAHGAADKCRLGIHDVAGLVRYAIRIGLISSSV